MYACVTCHTLVLFTDHWSALGAKSHSTLLETYQDINNLLCMLNMCPVSLLDYAEMCKTCGIFYFMDVLHVQETHWIYDSMVSFFLVTRKSKF